MTPLIIFADLIEATVTIKLLQAKKVKHNEKLSIFKSSKATLMITKIGLLETLASLFSISFEFDCIWNIGFSGIITNDIPLYSIRRIHSVELMFSPLPNLIDLYSLNYAKNTYPKINLCKPNENTASLITSTYPLRSFHTLSQNLIDMEGYSVAFAAKKLNKACVLWKIASDFTDKEHSLEKFLKEKEDLSKKIGFFIQDKLNIQDDLLFSL